MADAGATKMSRADYLEREKTAEVRSEYAAGELFAMEGASRVHARLVSNLGGFLRRVTQGGPCEAYINTVKVRVEAADAYLYPDAVVTCDPADTDPYVLAHPRLVVEVASPSTGAWDTPAKMGREGPGAESEPDRSPASARICWWQLPRLPVAEAAGGGVRAPRQLFAGASLDRGKKLDWYRPIPSVKEILLVDAESRSVHLVRREEAGPWSFHGWTESGEIELRSLGATLSLDELYDRVAEEPR